MVVRVVRLVRMAMVVVARVEVAIVVVGCAESTPTLCLRSILRELVATLRQVRSALRRSNFSTLLQAIFFLLWMLRSTLPWLLLR